MGRVRGELRCEPYRCVAHIPHSLTSCHSVVVAAAGLNDGDGDDADDADAIVRAAVVGRNTLAEDMRRTVARMGANTA